MTDFFILMASVLAFSWAIEHTYVGSPTSLSTKSKDRFCLLAIFLLLSFYIGLRTNYNDTYGYIVGYRNTVPLPELWDDIDFTLGNHPGFSIANSCLKSIGVSTQGFLLFFSMIAIGGSLYFFKRYSINLTLALFLFFTTNAYTFCAAAIKQTTATAIAFVAITFCLKKKWVPFTLLILLAATFHPYVLLYLLAPFLTFKPWSKWTYVLIAVSVAVGFSLESLLGSIIDLTTMIGDNYSEEALVGDGINIFRVLVSNVPLILTFLFRKQIFHSSSRQENLMVNLAMINGAIMFVGLFGKAIYFSRLASYFTVAQCVALPLILKKLPDNYRKLFTALMIIGYIGFFLYANVFVAHFDKDFARITFFEYVYGLIKQTS